MRRLIALVPTVLCVATVVFFVIRIAPGDVLSDQIAAAGGGITPERLGRLRHQLGIDKPVPEQYVVWFEHLVTGDFGKSLLTQQSTFNRFADALPASASVGALALVCSMLVGIPGGVLAASRRNRLSDVALRLFAVAGVALPSFVLATVLLRQLAVWFGYAPPRAYHSLFDNPLLHLQSVALPAILLAVPLAGAVLRITRTQLLETMSEDFVRTARAKGFNERYVLFRHALRAALLPVVTVIGFQLVLLIGGTTIIESIFGIPGVGNLTVQSLQRKDYTQVQTNLLLIGVGIMLINLLVDVLYAALDPRVRYS
jgi:peptide/nickel transport system permease protein